MKRSILCLKCTQRHKSIKRSYQGEHIKFVSGKAKEHFICDFCGTPISISDECTAESIWADYGGRPYYEWERDFIDVTP